MKELKILGIETSCDETGLAVVRLTKEAGKLPQIKIIKSVVASQIKIHRPWGGVVPHLAKREHLKNLPPLFGQIKPFAKKLDIVGVTVGPGLEPCLWSGVNFTLGYFEEIKRRRPKTVPKLVGVNHLEGHLASFLLDPKIRRGKALNAAKVFPAVQLVVSGGHTILVRMSSLTRWQKLGETRDDAIGEAFDKVARMLGLDYPGGPLIERLAKEGDAQAVDFPRPMAHSADYDFSFSGLKTAVLYYLKDNRLISGRKDGFSRNINAKTELNRRRADIAASFQAAAFAPLLKKTEKAVKEFGARSVIISGGVAANKALQSEMRKLSRRLGKQFFVAPVKYNTDNGIVIALAAGINPAAKLKIEAQANLSL